MSLPVGHLMSGEGNMWRRLARREVVRKKPGTSVHVLKSHTSLRIARTVINHCLYPLYQCPPTSCIHESQAHEARQACSCIHPTTTVITVICPSGTTLRAYDPQGMCSCSMHQAPPLRLLKLCVPPLHMHACSSMCPTLRQCIFVAGLEMGHTW